LPYTQTRNIDSNEDVHNKSYINVKKCNIVLRAEVEEIDLVLEKKTDTAETVIQEVNNDSACEMNENEVTEKDDRTKEGESSCVIDDIYIDDDIDTFDLACEEDKEEEEPLFTTSDIIYRTKKINTENIKVGGTFMTTDDIENVTRVFQSCKKRTQSLFIMDFVYYDDSADNKMADETSYIINDTVDSPNKGYKTQSLPIINFDFKNSGNYYSNKEDASVIIDNTVDNPDKDYEREEEALFTIDNDVYISDNGEALSATDDDGYNSGNHCNNKEVVSLIRDYTVENPDKDYKRDEKTLSP